MTTVKMEKLEMMWTSITSMMYYLKLCKDTFEKFLEEAKEEMFVGMPNDEFETELATC